MHLIRIPDGGFLDVLGQTQDTPEGLYSQPAWNGCFSHHISWKTKFWASLLEPHSGQVAEDG